MIFSRLRVGLCETSARLFNSLWPPVPETALEKPKSLDQNKRLDKLQIKVIFFDKFLLNYNIGFLGNFQ
tara:strand:- start:358 stop:564 length:207 start_codon:yes stop_codon:yes gene_type:complete